MHVMVRYSGTPGAAAPIAWYEDDFFAGKPAAAVHSPGYGKADSAEE